MGEQNINAETTIVIRRPEVRCVRMRTSGLVLLATGGSSQFDLEMAEVADADHTHSSEWADNDDKDGDERY
jgi:hypothetical protein